MSHHIARLPSSRGHLRHHSWPPKRTQKLDAGMHRPAPDYLRNREVRAVIRDEERRGYVAAELYEPPGKVWPGIRDSEPPGLYRGPVELEDGQRVEAKHSETELAVVPAVVEIRHHRRWRAHLVSR